MKGLNVIQTILFCHLCLLSYSQNWSTLRIENDSVRYDDIYFHDTNIGWAVNAGGQIYKTIDGGDTWDIKYDNNSGRYFRAIEFINEDIGIAGTLDNLLLRTEDGGETWTEIQDLIPTKIPGVCGLSHIDDSFYGVGVFYHPAYFIKSIDQGKSWTYSDLSEYADGLVECHFINAQKGFVGGIKEGIGGVLLMTNDGGNTWKEVLCSPFGMEYIWKLDFITDSVGYGAVESVNAPFTNIIKTIDGGDTWTILRVADEELDIQGIGFINEEKGWVAPRHDPMYETTDGGHTWAENPNLYTNINRMFRVNPDLMFASGTQIYKYSNFPVATKEPSHELIKHTISISGENPFQNQVEFVVNIERNTNARIDLISYDGRHINNIFAGRIESGKNPFLLNTSLLSNIPDGIYFIALRTNEGFSTKKIVKGK